MSYSPGDWVELVRAVDGSQAGLRGKVTSTDWSRYKILTMGEMPDIKVVQISRDDHGFGGGSEAANAVVPAAVAAAFFDATGIHARRIPLTPDYVTTLLKANPLY